MISDGQSPFCFPSWLCENQRVPEQIGSFLPLPSDGSSTELRLGEGAQARDVSSLAASGRAFFSRSHGGLPQSLEFSGVKRKGGMAAADVHRAPNRLLFLQRTVLLWASFRTRLDSLLQTSLLFLLQCLLLTYALVYHPRCLASFLQPLTQSSFFHTPSAS